MAIYLDYNATAPLCYEAYQAASEAFSLLGNPSSVHGFGRVVRQKIETARQHIADFLGVSSQRLVFTSGATESNNLALASFPGRVLISAIEHDSIQAVREDAILIPVLEDGTLDLEALEKLLSQPYQGPTLVSVMMANNETGVIQPLFDVITLARQYGAVVHSDAVQGLGRLEFPWHNLDMISFSSHKIGGPTGVGCLIVPAEGVDKSVFIGQEPRISQEFWVLPRRVLPVLKLIGNPFRNYAWRWRKKSNSSLPTVLFLGGKPSAYLIQPLFLCQGLKVKHKL